MPGILAQRCAKSSFACDRSRTPQDPLYDEHVRLGAKIVPFAGWLMPVQYTSIVEEHQAVRNNLGIFDISHMGQLIVAATRQNARRRAIGSTPC